MGSTALGYVIIWAASKGIILTNNLADSDSYLLHAPRWEQISRYPAVGQPEIQRGGRDQDR